MEKNIPPYNIYFWYLGVQGTKNPTVLFFKKKKKNIYLQILKKKYPRHSLACSTASFTLFYTYFW